MRLNEIAKGVFINIKRSNLRTEPSGTLKVQGENEEPTKEYEKKQPMHLRVLCLGKK